MSRVVSACQIFRDISAKGAHTIVYLASSPDVANTTEQYFYSPCRYAVAGGPRRPNRFIALAAQRDIGRHEKGAVIGSSVQLFDPFGLDAVPAMGAKANGRSRNYPGTDTSATSSYVGRL